MTILPEPASRPWFNMRAMFVLVPGLSDGYQLRISRMRAVNSMSASGSFEGREAISREPHRSRNPRLPCREAGWLTALGRREGTAGWAGFPSARRDAVVRGGHPCTRRPRGVPPRLPLRSRDTRGSGGPNGSVRDEALRAGRSRRRLVQRSHQVLPYQFRAARSSRLVPHLRREERLGQPGHRAEEAPLELRPARLAAHSALDRL